MKKYIFSILSLFLLFAALAGCSPSAIDETDGSVSSEAVSGEAASGEAVSDESTASSLLSPDVTTDEAEEKYIPSLESVDWEGYSKELSAKYYADLQDFFPYLRGQKEMVFVTDVWDEYTGAHIEWESERQTLLKGIQNSYLDYPYSEVAIEGFYLVDFCGTGHKDMLIEIGHTNGDTVLLHYEPTTTYAMVNGRRFFGDKRENGLFNGGKDPNYYKMSFVDGHPELEAVAAEDYDPEKDKEYFYIGKKKVTKRDFKKFLGKEAKYYSLMED